MRASTTAPEAAVVPAMMTAAATMAPTAEATTVVTTAEAAAMMATAKAAAATMHHGVDTESARAPPWGAALGDLIAGAGNRARGLNSEASEARSSSCEY